MLNIFYRNIVDDFASALLGAVSNKKYDDDTGEREDSSSTTDVDIKDCFIVQHNVVTTAVSIANAIILTGQVFQGS